MKWSKLLLRPVSANVVMTSYHQVGPDLRLPVDFSIDSCIVDQDVDASERVPEERQTLAVLGGAGGAITESRTCTW